VNEQPHQLGSSYTLHRVIGKGAYGQVWSGTDRAQRALAFKLLHPHLAADVDIVHRFLKERGAISSIDHPNVVKVSDLVAEGDTLAIVMELIDGTDLRTYLREQGTLSPAEVASLGAAIASALSAAHAKGIVHRDVKPENVLLDRSVTPAIPRLTDFGVAKIIGDSSHQTMLLGTPNYMAPELVEDEPSAAADVYSLGIVLYEMSCGLTPYASAGTPMAVLRAHSTQAPGRPPGIPDELWQYISWATAKNPAQRPSASTLGAELTKLSVGLQGLPAAPVLSMPPRSHNAEAEATVRGRASYEVTTPLHDTVRRNPTLETAETIRRTGPISAPGIGIPDAGIAPTLPAIPDGPTPGPSHPVSSPGSGKSLVTAIIVGALAVVAGLGVVAYVIVSRALPATTVTAPAPNPTITVFGPSPANQTSPQITSLGALNSSPAPVGVVSSRLTDLQPGVGTRKHDVMATAASPSQGREVVVWVSSAGTSGNGTHTHVFPYAVLAPGETRTVTLDIGGGSGDIGHSFLIELCEVGSASFAQVSLYQQALQNHTSDETRMRNYGVDVASAGDYSCQGRVVVTRTS
jgi:serine/threonine-protein kinase